MGIITDTYTDTDTAKSFLVLELYDADTLTANITMQAANAKKWVNTYLGRSTNFSVAQLAEIKNEGIVLSASQKTACFMELKRQERASVVAEETKIDCKAAETTLLTWMGNNNVTPPDMKKGTPMATKITIVTSEKEHTI